MRVHLVSIQNLYAIPSTHCRCRMESARVPYLKIVVLHRYVAATTLKTTYRVNKIDINVDVRVPFV